MPRTLWLLALPFALACGNDPEPGGQSTTAAGGGGGGGAEGVICKDGAPCSGIANCSFPEGSCDSDVEGFCFTGPCDGPVAGPVCQCDGTVLETQNATCDLTREEARRPEPSLCQVGTFPCGDIACRRHAEYCIETTGGPAPGTTTYTCMSSLDNAHAACGLQAIPDCACVRLDLAGCVEGADCQCETDADFNERVIIALP